MVSFCGVLRSLRLTIEFFFTNTDSGRPVSHEGYGAPGATNPEYPDATHIDPAEAMDGDVSDSRRPMPPEDYSAPGATDAENPDGIDTDPAEAMDGDLSNMYKFESRFSDTSAVVVEHFTVGKPGAPIPGTRRGQTWYDQVRARHGDSTWAPFWSQRDWVVAHWAKIHGAISTVLNEFLAFPEVSVASSNLICY